MPALATMPLGATTQGVSQLGVMFEPASFADLPFWSSDDPLEALRAFVKSCGPVLASVQPRTGSVPARAPSPDLLARCRDALALDVSRLGRAEARAFFETRFQPHRVVHRGAAGLLTGYYEPELEGARTRGGPYQIPIYRRPPDLVNLVAESERGALGHALTHARKTAHGSEPYATRAEIEAGALDGQGLELVWLENPVDAFFLHVQGSGRLRLPDGKTIRISYDGKNGHPYTSIGRYLIDTGLFPADRMSLEALKDWLKSDVERGRAVMWQNESFVFFRELEGAQAESPLGVLEVPLTEGRSLAVDTAFHAIGTPIFVSSPQLTHAGSPNGFHRLMIAQDVGSAIRGPERGDIYFGSGDAAGKLAGNTKHPGSFFAFLPRTQNSS